MRAAHLAFGGGAVFLMAAPAWAAPEEIQVYMDEMNEPGQFGLDVHANFVFSGQAGAEEPGVQPSVRRLRITPEFALGLTPNLELGLYLPLATVEPTSGFGVHGAKLRLKYIAPRQDERSWFWGGNFEIGRVDSKLDPNPYNAELKGILGHRAGRVTVAFNANLDFKVSGPARSPATIDVDTKASYALTPELSLGFENYTGLGTLRRPGTGTDQTTLLTFDANLGRWDLNVGVGTAYGATRDGLIVKAIIGIPIDRRPNSR